MHRQPSVDTRRTLREEANHGCVLCGAPLLEYHHIEHDSDKARDDPDRMVAVCPTCRQNAEQDSDALSKEELDHAKTNPHNSSSREYPFVFDSRTPDIVFGGNRAQLHNRDWMAVLRLDDERVLEVSFIDNLLMVSAVFRDAAGNLVAEIVNNDWLAYTTDEWELEYTSHGVKMWQEQRDIGIDVSYATEADELNVGGNFHKHGKLIRATPGSIQFGEQDATISGARTDDEALMIGADYDTTENTFLPYRGGQEREL